MTNVPNCMPVLSSGSHSDPSKGACIMEYASFLAGEKWSDRPSCTHPVLARVAQQVNDITSDADRHLLLPLLPRLMGTSEGKDDRALCVRLAVWAARRAAHLNPDPRVMAAIEAAEAWIESPNDAAVEVSNNAFRAAYHAASESYSVDNYSAGSAADTASYAARSTFTFYFVASAGSAATYSAIATNDTERIEFLSDLITEYDRLTGRTEYPTVSEDDLRRCAELTV